VTQLAEPKNNPAGALRQVQRGAISIGSLGYFEVKVKGCSHPLLQQEPRGRPNVLAHNRLGNIQTINIGSPASPTFWWDMADRNVCPTV